MGQGDSYGSLENGVDVKSKLVEENGYPNFWSSKYIRGTCNVLPEKHKMFFIYGDKIYMYDFLSESMEKIKTPRNFDCHTSCLCFSGSRTFLLVCGGVGNYGGEGVEGNGVDVHEFIIEDSIRKCQWIPVEIDVSKRPLHREGHTANINPINGSEVFVFGGMIFETTATNPRIYSQTGEFWKYDVNERKWTSLPVSHVHPNARYNHSSVVIKKYQKLLIFGGFHSSKRYLNDLWEYSFSNNEWKDLNFENQNNIIPRTRFNFIKLRNPKNYHNDNYESKIILGTGYYSFMLPLNQYSPEDLTCYWELDYPKKRWNKIIVNENELRIFNSYTVGQYRNKVYIFGGRASMIPENKELGDLLFGDLSIEYSRDLPYYYEIPNGYILGDLFDKDLKERIEYLNECINTTSSSSSSSSLNQWEISIFKISLLCVENISVMKILLDMK